METLALWKIAGLVVVCVTIIVVLAPPMLSSKLSEMEPLTRDGLGLMEQDDDGTV